MKQWSFGGQFQEFGRGVLNLSGLVYFLPGGRRHALPEHGAHRPAALGPRRAVVVLAAALPGPRRWPWPSSPWACVSFLSYHDLRLDATSERLSSLSPYTIELIDQLQSDYDKAEVKRPVRIEAFISPEVPESYVQTRLNLLSTLRELKARAGNMMEVQVNDTEQFGPLADLAKKRYDITPHRVTSVSPRGLQAGQHLHGRGAAPAAWRRWCCPSSTAASRWNTNWSARSARSPSRSGSGSG